jgi:putative protease
VLNDLRRKASEELTRRRLDARKHEVREWTAENSTSHPWAASKAADDVPVSNPQSAIRNPQFSVLVRSLDQLDAVLPHRPAMVYCDFEDLRRYKEAVPLAKSAGVPIGLATLRIIKPGEDGLHANIVRAEPDAVLIRNLGSLAYYREAMPQAELIGDFSLNVANELAAEWLVSQGCSRLVPSFDLNWDQFAALLNRFNPVRLEPVVHQHMPMFHMEHCVFAAFLSTGKDHRDCGRPCDRHRIELNDRVGAAFPVHPDTGCRNTVYNSVPQSAAEYLPRMRELGVRRVRIDLLRETAEQIGPLLETYRSILEGQTDGRDTWKRLKAQNQLGVTRGTLQMV